MGFIYQALFNICIMQNRLDCFHAAFLSIKIRLHDPLFESAHLEIVSFLRIYILKRLRAYANKRKSTLSESCYQQ